MAVAEPYWAVTIVLRAFEAWFQFIFTSTIIPTPQTKKLRFSELPLVEPREGNPSSSQPWLRWQMSRGKVSSVEGMAKFTPWRHVPGAVGGAGLRNHCSHSFSNPRRFLPWSFSQEIFIKLPLCWWVKYYSEFCLTDEKKETWKD